MPILPLKDVRLNWRQDGNPTGAPVVMLHALGTDHRLFDRLLPLMPPDLRIIRPDMRGHGASTIPGGPGKMGTLVRDVEYLMDQLALKDAVIVGVSIGGMIAQALAAKRLDLVRAIVLANTAVKIGTPATWAVRIAEVRTGGIAAITDSTIARWFGPHPKDADAIAAARGMLSAQSDVGYIAGCEAISGTDLLTPTSGLTLPTLVIAGTRDGSTPPDLVHELAGLIRGARYQLIRGAGHLACLDQPAAFAAHVADFLRSIAHDRRHTHP